MQNYKIEEYLLLKHKIDAIKKPLDENGIVFQKELSEETKQVIEIFENLYKGFVDLVSDNEDLENEKENLEYENDNQQDEIRDLETELEEFKSHSVYFPNFNLPTEDLYNKVDELFYKYGPYKLYEKLNKL